MTRAQLNHLADDDRISTDIASESDSVFLSICLFVNKKQCSFDTLSEFNSITVNNNNL